MYMLFKMDVFKWPRFSLSTHQTCNSKSNTYVKENNHLTQDPVMAGHLLIQQTYCIQFNTCTIRKSGIPYALPV